MRLAAYALADRLIHHPDKRSVDLVDCEEVMIAPSWGTATFFVVGDSSFLAAVPNSDAQIDNHGRQGAVSSGQTLPCFPILPRLPPAERTRRAVVLSHELVSRDYVPYTPITTRSLLSPNFDEGTGEGS